MLGEFDVRCYPCPRDRRQLVLAAFAWGFVAASTLIVGGAVALRFGIGERALGLVMAFGSGVLISAVAFELVQEAYDKAGGHGASPSVSASGRRPSISATV